MAYYAETGSAKAGIVSQHILEQFFNEDAQRRKMIIFAHHQIVIDSICVAFAKRVRDSPSNYRMRHSGNQVHSH